MDIRGNRKVYEWLRDEFSAGNCPCWFGDSYGIVWASIQHAMRMERQLAIYKKQNRELKRQLRKVQP